MAKRVASLEVEIGSDLSGLTEGLGKASASLQSFGVNIASIGAGLSKTLTAAASAAVGGLVALQRATGNYADKLLDLEAITGISTDTLQEFRNVARVAGVDSDVLSNAVSGLARRMPSITTGTGPAAEAMAKLGVSARDASGQMRPTEDIMMDVIGALGAMDNEMERAALATQVLGRSYEQIIPVITMGGNAIDDAREQAHELGMVMDKDALNAANNFRIALSELTERATAMGRDFAVKLMPIITNTVIPGIEKLIGIASKVLDRFTGMSAGAQRLTLLFVGLAAAIGPALVIMGKVAIVLSAMISPIGLVIAGIAALVAGIVYAADNWDALAERVSDIGWWRNTLIDMVQFMLDYNVFSLMIDGFNAMLAHFGRTTIPNPFSGISESLEGLRVETKEYENELGSFYDAVINGIQRISGIDLRSPFGGMADGADADADKFQGSALRISEMQAHVVAGTMTTQQRLTELAGQGFTGVTQQFETFAQHTEQIGQALQRTMTDAATSFADSFGRMIATGSQGGSFFNMLLGLAGSFASQFGRIVMGIGIAALQLQPANLFSNPTQAIAAGAALVALGGALQQLSQRGIGGFGSGGGTVQQDFTPSTSTSVQGVGMSGGVVHFEIMGDKLVGVLDNNSRRKNRIG